MINRFECDVNKIGQRVTMREYQYRDCIEGKN